MKARLWDRLNRDISATEFVDIVVWQVPQAVPGSAHLYKYSYAFMCDGVCVLRYDNERGKGDHRHWDDEEAPYEFISIDRLAADFWRDLRQWRIQNGRLQGE